MRSSVLLSGCADASPRNHVQEPESETIYNPLKLPLGWDGKPIPYWCVSQLMCAR
jgi:splicing factor 3A subunit 3